MRKDKAFINKSIVVGYLLIITILSIFNLRDMDINNVRFDIHTVNYNFIPFEFLISGIKKCYTVLAHGYIINFDIIKDIFLGFLYHLLIYIPFGVILRKQNVALKKALLYALMTSIGIEVLKALTASFSLSVGKVSNIDNVIACMVAVLLVYMIMNLKFFSRNARGEVELQQVSR